MRAQLYMERITSHLKFAQMPHKHFVFGNLRVDSGGGNGIASWRYHVAPIIRLRDGKLYVLDPALSANPIEKESWYKMMTELPGSTITGYVTCKSHTYYPSNICLSPKRVNGEILNGDTQGYLAA